MTNDPITIIKDDHGNVSALFKKYRSLGDGAYVTKRETVDHVIHMLTVHADMEEKLCYPIFKEALNKKDDKMVDEAYVEHQGIKNLMGKLNMLLPENTEFDATMRVLMEQMEHHVEEEETELLPKVKEEVDEATLEDMGTQMITFKQARIL